MNFGLSYNDIFFLFSKFQIIDFHEVQNLTSYLLFFNHYHPSKCSLIYNFKIKTLITL